MEKQASDVGKDLETGTKSESVSQDLDHDQAESKLNKDWLR